MNRSEAYSMVKSFLSREERRGHWDEFELTFDAMSLILSLLKRLSRCLVEDCSDGLYPDSVEETLFHLLNGKQVEVGCLVELG